MAPHRDDASCIRIMIHNVPERLIVLEVGRHKSALREALRHILAMRWQQLVVQVPEDIEPRKWTF